MTTAVLAVGLSYALLSDLDHLLPPASVTVLEEPDVLRARDGFRRGREHPCVARIEAAPTQAEQDPTELVDALATLAEGPFAAVLPAVEYAVVTAAAVASALGLPGAGTEAGRTLRDKGRLRVMAGRAGIAQPRWSEVGSAVQVQHRWADHGGQCVLKPANRQASLGVVLLGPDSDVEAAWRHTVAADEPLLRARHAVPARFLVEERLHGPEVSVESLVSGGVVGFCNVTAKQVLAGAFPVELGHRVPAALGAPVHERLIRSVEQLVEATGFGSGVLHSEWILVDGEHPHLIECAGRLPGDCIDLLVDLAHGGSLVRSWVEVLRGGPPVLLPGLRSSALRAATADRTAGNPDLPAEQPQPNTPPSGAAAIRFLTPTAGRVRTVTGLERARAVPGVTEVRITVVEGDMIAATTNSWQRAGHVIATASDAQQAAELARQGCEAIQIETTVPVETTVP